MIANLPNNRLLKVYVNLPPLIRPRCIQPDVIIALRAAPCLIEGLDQVVVRNV